MNPIYRMSGPPKPKVAGTVPSQLSTGFPQFGPESTTSALSTTAPESLEAPMATSPVQYTDVNATKDAVSPTFDDIAAQLARKKRNQVAVPAVNKTGNVPNTLTEVLKRYGA